MVAMRYKLFSFLQGLLVVLCALGIISLLTGVYSIQYNSQYGWTIERYGGIHRLIPLFFVAFFAFWYLANRRRSIWGYWIGLALGFLSILWNLAMVFVAFFAWDDGVYYSLWYSFAQLVKSLVIILLLWKIWIPMKEIYIQDEDDHGVVEPVE